MNPLHTATPCLIASVLLLCTYPGVWLYLAAPTYALIGVVLLVDWVTREVG